MEQQKSILTADVFIRGELINSDQLQEALEEQKRSGSRLSDVLLNMGYIDEYQLAAYLSKQYGVPSINLDNFDIDPEALKHLSRELAIKYNLIPINHSDSTLVIAMSDPSNIFAIDEIKFATGQSIEVVVASERLIEKFIHEYYGTEREWQERRRNEETYKAVDKLIGELKDYSVEFKFDQDINVKELERASEEAPVIRLVNHLLLDALRRGASDIHIEPYSKDYRIRYRIDGVLYDIIRPPTKLRNAVSSRIKVMANLDIAERRLPQDGRIRIKFGKDRNVEYRVSIIPTLFGEKVVMRILDQESLQLDLTKLGYDEEQMKAFRQSIFKPYGMVLITGPTGSGKTTTLYSSLMDLNSTEVNISTAEDPVEYSLPGVNQVQIHDEIGLTFAFCLRSFLRQDPDVILVGEIRDYETAEIAIKSALTGHLVLSTLHTNDAPSSITRLLNMGVEPFLVTASLNAVVAQRLIRKVCRDCKIEYEVSPQVLIDLGVPPKEVSDFIVYKKSDKGCKRCLGTGYKGRIAVYEVMVISEELKEFVLSGASAYEIKREAMRQKMITLRQSALNKLKQGITTIAEVVRNTANDN
ncbi:MAG: type IV-A pilus assembly ATPase PilB [Deltaproteobacteria bacterium]|nr:type IV-A pilus assembly ATPase PilB [Deltaproteobacteria bacterium]